MKLTFAHGFTQTSRSWSRFTELLTLVADDVAERSQLESLAVDMPGHGDATALRLDLWDAADHLVARGGVATYVGYSMGGRVGLHAALAHPDQVERLVLIGATPGIEDDDERAARRVADEALADHIESVGVEQFVDEWLRNPLFAGLTDEAAQRSDRIRNTAAGLASSLRLAGTGTQDPLWNRLGAIACPVLLLVGADDAKFRAIAEQTSSLLPRATMATIEQSGHSAHLEQPERTLEAIRSWLDSDAARI